MKNLVRSFKALSDETRLRILNILLKRECCVCEVMQVLEISQPRASHHLIALYDAGFLKLRKAGILSLYSIDLEGMQKHSAHLIQAVQDELEGNAVAAADLEKLKHADRNALVSTVT